MKSLTKKSIRLSQRRLQEEDKGRVKMGVWEDRWPNKKALNHKEGLFPFFFKAF